MQGITRFIGILGGCAVLLYTIGFMVLKTYTYQLGLEGFFLFSEEQYREAGASFLLGMVRAPLWRPVTFFACFLPLLLIFRDEINLHSRIPGSLRNVTPAKLKRGQWGHLLAVFASLAALSSLNFLYNIYLVGNYSPDLLTGEMGRPLSQEFSPEKKALVFFSLLTPIAGVVGYYIYRLQENVEPSSSGRKFFRVMVAAYTLFLVSMPIIYGAKYYDLKIFPLTSVTPLEGVSWQKIGVTQPDERNDDTYFQIWLLGKFNGMYVFLTKKEPNSQGRLEMISSYRLKHMKLDSFKVDYLRDQVQPVAQKKKIVRDITEFLGIEEK